MPERGEKRQSSGARYERGEGRGGEKGKGKRRGRKGGRKGEGRERGEYVRTLHGAKHPLLAAPETTPIDGLTARRSSGARYERGEGRGEGEREEEGEEGRGKGGREGAGERERERERREKRGEYVRTLHGAQHPLAAAPEITPIDGLTASPIHAVRVASIGERASGARARHGQAIQRLVSASGEDPG